MSEQKPHLTITEVMQIVGVSRPLVYRAISDGSLRTWRTWSKGHIRIRREDLDAWTNAKSQTN
jgi:excisionase family DNA binding protein